MALGQSKTSQSKTRNSRPIVGILHGNNTPQFAATILIDNADNRANMSNESDQQLTTEMSSSSVTTAVAANIEMSQANIEAEVEKLVAREAKLTDKSKT